MPVVLLDAGLRRHTVVSAVKAGVAGRLVLPAAPAQLKEILATIAAGGLPAGMARSRQTESGRGS